MHNYLIAFGKKPADYVHKYFILHSYTTWITNESILSFKYISPKHLTGVLKCLSTENSQLKGNQNFIILF